MLRKIWPPVTEVAEEPEPAMSHWVATRTGGQPILWPSSPQWLGRYLDNILHAHLLSARKEGYRF